MPITSDATTKKPRDTWKHTEIPALIREYEQHGLPAARKLYPDRDVDAKLQTLNLLDITKDERFQIESFIATIGTMSHPTIAVRYLKSALAAAMKFDGENPLVR